jgi:hypothetical protein
MAKPLKLEDICISRKEARATQVRLHARHAGEHRLAYDRTDNAQEIIQELIDVLGGPGVRECLVFIEHKQIRGDGGFDTRVVDYAGRRVDEVALRRDFELAALWVPCRGGGAFTIRYTDLRDH